MKQIYIEKQAKDQVHQNFRNANSEIQHSIIREQPNSDFLNIFLIQNKGEGPPGNVLNPDHPPDNKAGPASSPLSLRREGQGVSQNRFLFQKQTFLQYQNLNFLQTLNFQT